MTRGVELLKRGVKSCRGIGSSPVDTCPSVFHRLVMTVPVDNADDTSEPEMKTYGLGALAPLAITYRSSPADATVATGGWGTGAKARATPSFQIELSQFDLKNLLQWAQEFSEFLLITGHEHANLKTNCTLIKTSCKR